MQTKTRKKGEKISIPEDSKLWYLFGVCREERASLWYWFLVPEFVQIMTDYTERRVKVDKQLVLDVMEDICYIKEQHPDPNFNFRAANRTIRALKKATEAKRPEE